MICKNCGANYDSDLVKCPYCGTINESSLKKAKEVQYYDKNFEETRDTLLETGNLRVLRHLTIGLCLAFVIIATAFGGLTYYLEHRDAWTRQSEVKGNKYKANLTLINRYIDSKQYSRALLLVRATDPTYSSMESYPDIEEELSLIIPYTSFITYCQNGLTDQHTPEDVSLSSSLLSMPKRVYDAKPEGIRAKKIQEELSTSLDLYLKYLYRFTDDEINSLKTIDNVYDFEIEGTTKFDSIIIERMKTYENAHKKA